MGSDLQIDFSVLNLGARLLKHVLDVASVLVFNILEELECIVHATRQVALVDPPLFVRVDLVLGRNADRAAVAMPHVLVTEHFSDFAALIIKFGQMLVPKLALFLVLLTLWRLFFL